MQKQFCSLLEVVSIKQAGLKKTKDPVTASVSQKVEIQSILKAQPCK